MILVRKSLLSGIVDNLSTYQWKTESHGYQMLGITNINHDHYSLIYDYYSTLWLVLSPPNMVAIYKH